MLIRISSQQTRPTLKTQLKRSLASTLTLAFLLAPVLTIAAPSIDPPGDKTIQIRGGISVGANGDEIIPSLSLRDADVTDVLYGLAEQAGFNVIVDDSVNGEISLDLKDISINKVLEYIMTLKELSYYKDGNTYIITTAGEADSKDLNKVVLRSIPVRYSSAEDLEEVLNATVFSIKRPGGNEKAIATADPRTNSIIIMGNQQDIDLATRALAELDFPLQHKTFFLKHAPAEQVANTISQTLYSVSISSDGSGGSGSSSGSSSGSTSSGSSGGSSGSSAGGTGAGVTVFKGGPLTFISNSLNNTLTLVGTAEQIAQAEELMYDADIKPPQVAIQLTIISLRESRTKSLEQGLNGGLDPETGSSTALLGLGNFFGLNFSNGATVINFDPNSGAPSQTKIFDSLQLKTALTKTKGKVLANPTVIAQSGQTATIGATNDVLQGFTSQVIPGANGGSSTITSTPQIVQAGITMNVTPTVMNDGTIMLDLQPEIKDPGQQITSNNQTITLTSSTTINVAKARVKDGESLIIGGLIQENTDTSSTKVPFLSDIPVIGALFRGGNSSSAGRTELMIVVSPHILKEEGVAYFRKEWRDSLSYKQTSAPSDTRYAGETPRTIVPASNSGARNSKGGVQSLEQRSSDTNRIHGMSANRPANLPLQTYSEVLK